MTNNNNKEKKIDWGPIVFAGVALGGIYAIIRALKGWTPWDGKKYEEAMIILEDYRVELEELQPYVESIYAGDRVPTEQEEAILSSMVRQMELKEATVYNLSRTVWNQLSDIIKDAAKVWWTVPLVVFTPIAGYGTYKMIKGWFKNRRPPPGFTCPSCGVIFDTETGLKEHVRTEHRIATANIGAAQELFNQSSAWVQGAVAAEGAYGKINRDWRGFSLTEIGDVAWGITSAYGYSLTSIAGMSLLSRMSILLLVAI